MSISLSDITLLLSSHEAPPASRGTGIHAAVAMIVRENRNVTELLFIERSQHPDDPWSGNIGFPGGKVEAVDRTPRHTAERETLEELGFDLSSARYLGYLGEVAGAHLPVHVSCFVYALAATEPFSLNGEVVDAFWVPLTELIPPARHCTIPIPFRGEDIPRPAIRLPQAGKPYLWGITYRLVMELFRLLGCDGSPVDERAVPVST